MELEKLQRRALDQFKRHMELAVPRIASCLLEHTTFEPSVPLDLPMRTRFVEVIVSAVAEASQSFRQRESLPTEAQDPAVPRESCGFIQQPQVSGATDNMLFLPTTTLTHEPLESRGSVQQYGGLEYGLNNPTGLHDGLEHQNNALGLGQEETVDAPSLDMSFLDWTFDQDTSFQGP